MKRILIFTAVLGLVIILFALRTGQVPSLTDTPQRIAADAPKDLRKRQTIQLSYKNVAQQTESKLITTREDALAALTMETADVIADPKWKPVIRRIEQYILYEKDLDRFAERLREVSEAFSQ